MVLLYKGMYGKALMVYYPVHNHADSNSECRNKLKKFFSTDDFMCKPMRIVGETVIREVEEDRNSTSTNTLKSLKNIHTFVA
ncbi:hypothetical protein AC249_AIPGENE5324 [Exaiptasia diaphana]|nr:hypothetical protein AC249_AIPGENE5324 [Exaiptasia diaphana]